MHVEDVVGLDLAELEALAHQALAGLGAVRRRPDEGDDGVDHVEALSRPSTMCSRALALARRNSERRRMTLTWWSM